jgi:hypothetical protein
MQVVTGRRGALCLKVPTIGPCGRTRAIAESFSLCSRHLMDGERLSLISQTAPTAARLGLTVGDAALRVIVMLRQL